MCGGGNPLDQISNALGTDGDGGGIAGEISKAIETPSKSLLGLGIDPVGYLDPAAGPSYKNPVMQAVGAAAAIYFTGGAAAGAGAGAGEGAGIASSDAAFNAALASSYSGGAGYSVAASDASFAAALSSSSGAATGSSIISTLQTGTQIIGGVNAAKSLINKPAAAPVGNGGGQSFVPYLVTGNSPTVAYGQGEAPAAAAPVAAAVPASKSSDSTLTVLASVLTIAALLYQFMGTNK